MFMSVLSSRGGKATDRIVNVTNVCWMSDKFFYFSKGGWVLEEPFVKFRGAGSLSGRRGVPSALNDFIGYRKIENVQSGLSIVVDLPECLPLDWNWLRNVAAPLVHLRSQRRADRVLALRGSGNFSFFNGKFTILPVSQETVCAENSEVYHLEYCDDALRSLRELMAEEGELMNTVIILKSNESEFVVVNLNEIAEMICEDCEVHEIVAEECDDLVRQMNSAKFVVAPHSAVLSQALWMRGTLIEILPEGAECDEWTLEVSRAAGVRHLRFAVGEGTKHVAAEGEACRDDIGPIYSATVTVSSVEVIRRALS
jgi:hypothetical protein